MSVSSNLIVVVYDPTKASFERLSLSYFLYENWRALIDGTAVPHPVIAIVETEKEADERIAEFLKGKATIQSDRNKPKVPSGPPPKTIAELLGFDPRRWIKSSFTEKVVQAGVEFTGVTPPHSPYPMSEKGALIYLPTHLQGLVFRGKDVSILIEGEPAPEGSTGRKGHLDPTEGPAGRYTIAVIYVDLGPSQSHSQHIWLDDSKVGGLRWNADKDSYDLLLTKDKWTVLRTPQPYNRFG